MIKLIGVNKFIRKTEKQKARIKQGAANYVKATTKAMLRDLVLNTPQWSGNTAASWKVVLTTEPAMRGETTRLYEPNWEDLLDPAFKAKFIGDREAWKVAWEINKPVFDKIRYNSKISITNTSEAADWLATLSSAEAVEYLRPGNFIPGDVLAVKMVSLKYKLGSNLEALRLLKDFT